MRLEGVVWWHVNSSFYNCAASQVNSSVNPHKCGLSEPVGGFLDSAHINKKNPLDASYTFYNRKMNYKCSNFTIAVFAYLCTCVFVYLYPINKPAFIIVTFVPAGSCHLPAFPHFVNFHLHSVNFGKTYTENDSQSFHWNFIPECVCYSGIMTQWVLVG